MRLDTLNLLEEKVGNVLQLTGTRKGFLNRNPVAQALKGTLPTRVKWEHLILKIFCEMKDTII